MQKIRLVIGCDVACVFLMYEVTCFSKYTLQWTFCCFFLLNHFSHSPLRYFGHLLHSCIKTRPKSVFSLYFQTFWPKWLTFFGHFKNLSVYDQKKAQVEVPFRKCFAGWHCNSCNTIKLKCKPVITNGSMEGISENAINARCLEL